MDCQTGEQEVEKLEAQDQPGTQQSPVFAEVRRHPRFKLQTDIRVYSRSAGLLKGYTVDISESGISVTSS